VLSFAVVCSSETDTNGNYWPELRDGTFYKNNTLCGKDSEGKLKLSQTHLHLSFSFAILELT